MVPRPCRWTVPPGGGRQSSSRRAWKASRPPPVWHGSITGARRYALIYIIIIGRLCWPAKRPVRRWYLVSAQAVRALVDAPTWHRRYYSRLCWSVICGGRMWQITGKAPIKPCAPFCGMGSIIALTAQNAL